MADQLALSLDATPPGTYRQRGVSSLQRLFRVHFPELVARFEEFAKRLGPGRQQGAALREAGSASSGSPRRWSGFWPAVTTGEGLQSQTEYSRSQSLTRVRVTRRHHPLRGQELEVLRADKKHVVVRAPDGLSLKLPRLWTDVDGADGERDSSGDAIFTVESLRELAVLVEALAQRESGRRPERSEVPKSPTR